MTLRRCVYPYSLPVEGMLAWQHPQLIFHFEVLQADGTCLLWEERRWRRREGQREVDRERGREIESGREIKSEREREREREGRIVRTIESFILYLYFIIFLFNIKSLFGDFSYPMEI